MKNRLLGSLVVVLALTSLTASLAAQARKPYTPPRTPWGDPDIQGNFTNLYEVGSPFERPEQYAGKKLEEVNPEELK